MAPTESLNPAARPRLRAGVRMRFDASRNQHVLLSPEAILVLNPTGAAILELCDGSRSIAEIQEQLAQQYGEAKTEEIDSFLAELINRRGIEVSVD